MTDSNLEAMVKRHSIRVQSGPANYYSYPGAIDELAKAYDKGTLSRAVWISGARAERAAAPFIQPDIGFSAAQRFRFAGHVTHSFVNGVAAQLRTDTSLAIGIGGGGAIDATKALASKIDIPFVAIPTIAATCAAFTPLSVWYGDDGAALGYEVFHKGAEFVLVEPRIILAAPSEYLKAGLADTLAKWYEADILCSRETSIPHTARLGRDIAKTLRDILLEKGEPAFAAAAKGELTDDFIEVIDTIIAGGGLVGGLGERYTRIAAAHAVHNGLSALPESSAYLHGLKVAYGILVQAAIYAIHIGNAESSELLDLTRRFRSLGLPSSLRDFRIDPNDGSKINRFIEATILPQESIHLLPFPVTKDTLARAIALVERIRDEQH